MTTYQTILSGEAGFDNLLTEAIDFQPSTMELMKEMLLSATGADHVATVMLVKRLAGNIEAYVNEELAREAV